MQVTGNNLNSSETRTLCLIKLSSETLQNLPYIWKSEKKQNICEHTFFHYRFHAYIIVNVDAIELRCAFFLLSILNESFQI